MFTKIAHLPKLHIYRNRQNFSKYKNLRFPMPITSKSDFSQAGNPKGFHQGYHEMTYTKFQVSIIFAKMMGVGGGRGPLIILNPEKAEGNMQEL